MLYFTSIPSPLVYLNPARMLRAGVLLPVDPLHDLLNQLQKRCGPRGLRPASQLDAAPDLLPTGTPLDRLLGGGLDRGKLAAFVGVPTSGATTLALRTLAITDADALYIDLTRRFDPAYAAACGVDLDRVLIAHPPDAEAALSLAREAALSRALPLLVLDVDDPPSTLNRLHQPLALSRTTLLLLTRRSAPGAQVRVGLRCLGWIMRDGDVIGCHVHAELVQHPRRPVGESLTFPLRFGSEDAPC